jgi:hypothetical protein
VKGDSFSWTSVGLHKVVPGMRLTINFGMGGPPMRRLVAEVDGGHTLTLWPDTRWNRFRLPVVLRWRSLLAWMRSLPRPRFILR